MLIFCALSLTAYAQKHPLSKSDSGRILKNYKQYEFLLQQNDLRGASDALNSIAFIYWNDNQYAEAISYYEKSLGLNEKLANENGIAMIHNNLGMLYADIGRYEKSLIHFTQTLAARKANKEQIGVISALINMSVVLNNLQRYGESVRLLNDALEIARSIQDLKYMRSVYGMLSETYEKNGEVEESLKYFTLYRSFHEEVQREEIDEIKGQLTKEKMQKEIAEAARIKSEYENLKQKYELLEKEKIITEQDSVNKYLYAHLNREQMAIRLLERDKQVASLEAKTREQQNQQLINEKTYLRSIMITVIIAAVVLGFLIVFNLWMSKRHNRQIIRHNEKLLEKNRHIESQRKELLQFNKSLEEQKIELSATLLELESTRDKLVMTEKMATIGAFTAGIAHELNNACNYVAGSSDLLLTIFNEWNSKISMDGFDDNVAVHDLSEAIRTGVYRMKKIISDLKARQFNMEIDNFQNLDLISCIHKNLSVLSHDLSNNIKIELNVPNELKIEAIETQVNHLIYNLLINSIFVLKARENGLITIDVSSKKSTVVLKIKDNGIGIPKENLIRIFDPFFTTKEVGEGTGLGLYTVYYIVSSHNGEVSVDSEEGYWTEFTITLPKKQQPVVNKNAPALV